MKDKLTALGFSPASAFSKIQKGGSARSFFRFEDLEKGPCIYCEYSPEKEENFLYSRIADFLALCGVNVPKVHFHDSGLRILIMEDLGGTDLLDFSKGASFGDLEKSYKDALVELAKIHSTATAKFGVSPIRLMPKFDDALYTWEQDYFYDNLVRDFLGQDIPKPNEEWQSLRKTFGQVPESLLHRDFQSQNIIKRDDGTLGFIDFQGMRLGLFWYDVASLIFDPYAALPSTLRPVLYNYYCQIRGLDAAENSELFLKAASERLMQALGAFAFLGFKKGKPEYIGHIPAALAFLKECSALARLPKTCEIAEACEKSLAENRIFCEFTANAK